ncbi:MAG: hypothetical protein ACE5PO_02300 [Candidatus Bathyarchaeia archaeon]
MVLLTKGGFKLPFMGKDRFIELMRLGLGYDRQTRTFYIEDATRAQDLRGVLSEILKEEVNFGQTCVICNATFGCADCKFNANCPSRDVPLHCVCPRCYAQPNFAKVYAQKSETMRHDTA